MMYLLIWVFFAIVTAIVAHNKNRNDILWFILGAIFGIFAFVIVLVLKPIESDIESTTDNLESNDIAQKDTYRYKILPKHGVNPMEEWHKIKSVLFKHLAGNYKIRQNDTDNILLEMSKTTYIKMTQAKLADKNGSVKLYFLVESMHCGKIIFGDDVEVVSSEKEETITEEEKTNKPDAIDQLTKLSELLEKGHITEEEFAVQKGKLLNG